MKKNGERRENKDEKKKNRIGGKEKNGSRK